MIWKERWEENWESFEKKNYSEIGRLMDENWAIKKSLSKKISLTQIDDWYSSGIKAGAYGGKLIGAGGGGFLLFLTPIEKQNLVMESLHNLERHRIQIENLGSRIVYLE